MRNPFILAALLVSMFGCEAPSKPSTGPSAVSPASASTASLPLPQSFIVSKTPDAMVPIKAKLKSGIELLGYSLEGNPEPAPGDRFTITWYWRSSAPVESGWSFFTHFVDSGGNLVSSQNNSGSLRAKFSPHVWPAGRIVADPEQILVPTTWSSPTIQLRTGLWRGNDRMSVQSGPSDEENRILGPSLSIRLRPVASESARASEAAVDVSIAGRAPVIDGQIDGDPAWDGVAPLATFSDPVTGVSSQDLTEVRLLFDSKNLYLSMNAGDKDLQDAPGKNGEDLFGGDVLVILLKPDPASAAYYEIQISPSGAIYDASFRSWRKADGTFNSGVRARTRIDGKMNDSQGEDATWSIEASIPLGAFGVDLKALETAGATWNANFFRVDRGAGPAVFSAWSAPLRGDFHTLNRFGRIRFSTGAPTR